VGVVTVIEVAIGPGGAPGMFEVEVVASSAGRRRRRSNWTPSRCWRGVGYCSRRCWPGRRLAAGCCRRPSRPVREAGPVLFAGLLGTGEVAGR